MRAFAAILLVASAASAADRAAFDLSLGTFGRPGLAFGPSMQASATWALGSGFSLGGTVTYGKNDPDDLMALRACGECVTHDGAQIVRVGPALRYSLDFPFVFAFVQASPQYAADIQYLSGGERVGSWTRLYHRWDLAGTLGLGARIGSFTAGAQLEGLAGDLQGVGASVALGWRL